MSRFGTVVRPSAFNMFPVRWQLPTALARYSSNRLPSEFCDTAEGRSPRNRNLFGGPKEQVRWRGPFVVAVVRFPLYGSAERGVDSAFGCPVKPNRGASAGVDD